MATEVVVALITAGAGLVTAGVTAFMSFKAMKKKAENGWVSTLEGRVEKLEAMLAACEAEKKRLFWENDELRRKLVKLT